MFILAVIGAVVVIGLIAFSGLWLYASRALKSDEAEQASKFARRG